VNPERIIDILTSSTALALLILAIVAALVWLHHAQALAGRIQSRRALPAFKIMQNALARGAETGRAIHISPGAGAIGSRATTAETVVGLLAAERVADAASRNGAPLLVSSGDAVAHLALRGTLHRVYQDAGQGQNYEPGNVQLLAHQDSAAYATGVMTLYGRQKLEASQLLGSFSQEFLLAGEDGAQRGFPQVAGATSTAALPVMVLSAQETLIGEEIFAAEAYLSDDPASDARLRTQDALRNAVIWLLIAGLIYSLIQPFVPFLPALPEVL
jgi:hypothetical protein